MYKRIIALAAAVLMLIGSTQIPQASNGEEVKNDTTASVISESSTDDSGIKEIPEPADQPARGIYREVRLPDSRIAESSESSKGVEVDEYKGVLSTVSTDIWAGSSEGGSEEDGAESSGPDSAPADGAEPEPEGYSEDAAADSGEAEVVPEEPVAEEPSMEYLGTYTISFYCPAECCCGQWAWGATASGVMPTAWYTVASDLPFGTILYIDGLGTFEVQDRGVSGAWIDVFVSDHSEAVNNGLQYRDVYIVR